MTDKPTSYYEHAGYRCLSSIRRQTNDLYLTHCGIQVCPPLHSWGPDSRSEYHMHFILDGEGFLEIYGNTYHLQRGQIFILPPDVLVHYYADATNPWYYAWVGFHGVKVTTYLEQAGFLEGQFLRNTIIPPENFSSIIHEMLEANKLTVVNELTRVGYLYQLISLLIESNNDALPQKYNHYDYSIDTYVEHALQYIQFNYNTNIQINDLVNYIGINRSYLSYVFKKKLQMSPKEYLIHFRMEKAKELLSSDSSPIQDIARKVGYQDPLTFSKMFHRIVGVSPTQYREQSTAL